MLDRNHLRCWRTLAVGLILGLMVLVSLPAIAADDSPKAKISDLAWMTGNWSGALGPNTLEERWSEPKGGSIAALVRMSGGDATSMIELIVVEQDGESLVLRVQQWDPGFKPRTEGPQTMRLKELADRSVTWEAIDEGGLAGLTYARPADDEFTISILNAQGGAFKIELKAVK